MNPILIDSARQGVLKALTVLMTSAVVSACGGGGGNTTATAVSTASFHRSTSEDSLEVRSAMSSVSVSGRTGSEQTIRAIAPSLDVSVWTNSATGTWILKEAVSGEALSIDKTPTYTAVRVYSSSNVFVGGALAYDRSGKTYVSPMRYESDTSDENRQSIGETATQSAISRVRTLATKKTSNPIISAADETCEQSAIALTTGPASFSESASNWLDGANTVSEAKGYGTIFGRVGKVTQVLSNFLKNSSSMCDESTKLTADVNLERAAIIGAFDEIFDTHIQSFLDSVATAEQVSKRIGEIAQAALPKVRTRATSYVSSEAPAQTGVSGSTNTAIASLNDGKRFIVGVTNCVSGTGIPKVLYGADGSVVSFRYENQFSNQCSYPVNVLYCIGQAACTPNNFRAMGAGGQFSLMGQEQANAGSPISDVIGLLVCPDKEQGKTVYLDARSGITGCYIYKN